MHVCAFIKEILQQSQVPAPARIESVEADRSAAALRAPAGRSSPRLVSSALPAPAIFACTGPERGVPFPVAVPRARAAMRASYRAEDST